MTEEEIGMNDDEVTEENEMDDDEVIESGDCNER